MPAGPSVVCCTCSACVSVCLCVACVACVLRVLRVVSRPSGFQIHMFTHNKEERSFKKKKKEKFFSLFKKEGKREKKEKEKKEKKIFKKILKRGKGKRKRGSLLPTHAYSHALPVQVPWPPSTSTRVKFTGCYTTPTLSSVSL